ncbi:hypothetical protein [Thermococcus sp. LS2]|uniref:hypothetical protein n=1 Tax=Thermococcus sp. LS2 TaxID=1638260 RepID=UPI001438722C|nr:hypothetical protein [Thermococcus sp. LS2]NJE13780.1 hypothetical protein [Thermococcus sp. LS2]
MKCVDGFSSTSWRIAEGNLYELRELGGELILLVEAIKHIYGDYHTFSKVKSAVEKMALLYYPYRALSEGKKPVLAYGENTTKLWKAVLASKDLIDERIEAKFLLPEDWDTPFTKGIRHDIAFYSNSVKIYWKSNGKIQITYTPDKGIYEAFTGLLLKFEKFLECLYNVLEIDREFSNVIGFLSAFEDPDDELWTKIRKLISPLDEEEREAVKDVIVKLEQLLGIVKNLETMRKSRYLQEPHIAVRALESFLSAF